MKKIITASLITLGLLAAPAFAKSGVKLGMLTCSMLAAPFYFGSRIRGVISAVKLKPIDRGGDPDPEPFGRRASRRLSLTSKILETFFDEKLLSAAFGLD